MQENWPPEGYSSGEVYEKNDRAVLIMGAIIAIVFGFSVLSPITIGIRLYDDMMAGFASQFGIGQSTVAILGMVFVMGGLCLLCWKVLIPIHEAIHYGVGLVLDMNPEFGYEEGWLLDNPSVVALTTGIPVWKNLAMIVAPFALIGISSWILVQVTGGLVAGIAAFVLLANSASSAQDLYHYVRLLRMNPNTKFANFKEGDEIRTEYAVPESN